MSPAQVVPEARRAAPKRPAPPIPRVAAEEAISIPMEPGRHFVLVVDADGHRGKALARDLQAAGCYAACATSAARALRYALENEPDAVVSEWELPDMTAVELCRRIKSARWETRVILHREAADAASLRRTLENGGSDLLSRPVSAAALVALLAPRGGPEAALARNELAGVSRR